MACSAAVCSDIRLIRHKKYFKFTVFVPLQTDHAHEFIVRSSTYDTFICLDLTSQTQLPHSLLDGVTTSTSGDHIDILLDGMHAIVGFVIDVSKSTSVTSSEFSVSSRKTSMGDWLRNDVYKV